MAKLEPLTIPEEGRPHKKNKFMYALSVIVPEDGGTLQVVLAVALGSVGKASVFVV